MDDNLSEECINAMAYASYASERGVMTVVIIQVTVKLRPDPKVILK
jgi:hypothetical protein